MKPDQQRSARELLHASKAMVWLCGMDDDQSGLCPVCLSQWSRREVDGMIRNARGSCMCGKWEFDLPAAIYSVESEIATASQATTDAETLANRDARIAEITARVNAATEGPWTVDIESDCQVNLSITIPEINRRLHDCEWADEDEWDRDYRNSVFIANARADIPWLLARLAEAEKRSDDFRLQYEQTYDLLNAWKASLAEAENAKGERDRLKRAIKTALFGLNPQLGCNAWIISLFDTALAPEQEKKP